MYIEWNMDAKKLLDILSKMTKVTNSILVNAKFESGKLTLKSGFNQYFMSYNLPVEYATDSDSVAEFCFKSDVLCSFLNGKKDVTFVLQDNTLKFKSGRSRGSIQLTPPDQLDIDFTEDKVMDSRLLDFIFENLYLVDFLNKDFSKDATLRIQVKDSRIKMMVFENYFSFLVNREINIKEDLEFELSLVYADLLTSIFSKEDNLRISIEPNRVGFKTDSCCILVPRKIDSNDIKIDFEEELWQGEVISKEADGAILLPNKSEILEGVKELKTFCGSASNDASIALERVNLENEDQIQLRVKNNEGQMTKSFERFKTTGNFKGYVKIEPLLFLLDAIPNGTLKISEYPGRVVIRSNSDPDSRYIFFNQEEK